MKKLFVLMLAALVVVGCARKEKTGLKDVLIQRFSEDQDLKDYKLDPEQVADCVVDEIASSLPGFAGDPRREEFFKAYERFFTVKSAQDAENSVKDFEQLFGSRQKAREAALGVTDYIMTCMGKAIENAPSDGHRVEQPEREDAKSSVIPNAPAKP